MNLNLYLESGLYAALTEYSLKNNITKNQAVRGAIKKSLQKSGKKEPITWSKEFLNWKGLGEDVDIFKRDYSMFKEEDLSKSWLDD